MRSVGNGDAHSTTARARRSIVRETFLGELTTLVVSKTPDAPPADHAGTNYSFNLGRLQEIVRVATRYDCQRRHRGLVGRCCMITRAASATLEVKRLLAGVKIERVFVA